jgi:hypothetical protein
MQIKFITKMIKQPKTKVYPIRLNTVLLNEAHTKIEPSELRLRIKNKINNYLKTIK